MVDPIILQSISILISSFGMIIALIYYTQTLRYTNKARQRELIILRSQSYSMEYADAYADVVGMEDWSTVVEFHSKYGRQADPRAFAKWLYIRNVYNLAGLLLKEKEADPDLIFELYAPNAVIHLWEQHEPLIQAAREAFKHPGYYKPFEHLYNEAKRRYPEISSEVTFEDYLALQKEKTE